MINPTTSLILILLFAFYSCKSDMPKSDMSNTYNTCGFQKMKEIFYGIDTLMTKNYFLYSTFDSNKINIQNHIYEIIEQKDSCLLSFYERYEIHSDSSFSEILFETNYNTAKYTKERFHSLPDSVILHNLLSYRNMIVTESTVLLPSRYSRD